MSILDTRPVVPDTATRPDPWWRVTLIAGGANMLATQATSTIGDQNLEAIRRLLAELRIPVVAEHCVDLARIRDPTQST